MAAIGEASVDQILVSRVPPTSPEIIRRLEEGIDVADIGCGSGYAANVMAKAFPNSRFVGIDFSDDALNVGVASRLCLVVHREISDRDHKTTVINFPCTHRGASRFDFDLEFEDSCVDLRRRDSRLPPEWLVPLTEELLARVSGMHPTQTCVPYQGATPTSIGARDEEGGCR